MNFEYIKNKVNNFKEEEWSIGKNVLSLKENLDIVLKLQNKELRENDEILKESVYDDIFKTYNIDHIVSAKVYNKENELDLAITLFYVEDVLIPFPVGANMVNDFYENEYRIAKAFSKGNNTLNKFDTIMKGYKIYSSEE